MYCIYKTETTIRPFVCAFWKHCYLQDSTRFCIRLKYVEINGDGECLFFKRLLSTPAAGSQLQLPAERFPVSPLINAVFKRSMLRFILCSGIWLGLISNDLL